MIGVDSQRRPNVEVPTYSSKFESFYDVAVVGGGAAGVAAAVGAASHGAGRVLSIEGTSQLGGAVTGAMHRSLCGLYSGKPASVLDTLNGGVQRQVVSLLVGIDSSNVVVRPMGRTWVLEIPAGAYQSALERVCSKPNIDRVMNTKLTGVRREGNRILAIEVGGNWVEVGSVVDCSGAGVVMQMLGEDVMLPADMNRMLGGYAIRLSGLTGDGEMMRLQVPYVLAMAVAGGSLPQEARFTMFHPGPGNGEGICKLAVRVDAGGVEALAGEVVECLKLELEGFARAVVVESSDKVVARDGRRLRGRVVVMEGDLMNAREDDGNGVRGWWPIETWDAKSGPVYAYPPEGKAYGVPDGAMCSRVIENLFAAGTCVSATAGAAASLRASGICLATGEAAGRLAVRFTGNLDIGNAT